MGGGGGGGDDDGARPNDHDGMCLGIGGFCQHDLC